MSNLKPQDDHDVSAHDLTQASSAPSNGDLGATIDSASGVDDTVIASGSRLNSRSGGGLADDPASMPEVFGNYKLIRELHRGGQGVVYLAQQESTRRRVAIKVMKEGPFSGVMDQQRFEREVHLLAQLKHPSIVAIHESGVAAGNHYFVMDFIEGLALDAHVKAHAKTVSDKLTLFAEICEAVNFAHNRGIIHRDLKPSNIRVDEQGKPHVLDFGLAKSVSDDSNDVELTATGNFLGSLPWASPEQAEAIPNKIDMRTDVYSLGVVLYQMLTGKLPYSVSGGITQAIQNIRHAMPDRPSSVDRRINDEIETIVLKCMAKEQDRRYQTAGEVARDVRRYLSGEAIEAKRDSAMYVVSKALRRHRGRVAAAVVPLVMLVVFSVAITFAYGRVSEEARKARMVATFLRDIVVSVDPEIAARSTKTPLYESLRETVDNAAGRIDALVAEPETQAELRLALGSLYLNLGLYDEALTQLEPAVDTLRAAQPAPTIELGEALRMYGGALKQLNQPDAALAAYQEALEIHQLLSGQVSKPVGDTLNALGQLYERKRDPERAEEYLREAWVVRGQLGDPRDIATSEANLGTLLGRLKRFDEAEPLLRDALASRQELYGDEHFHTVVSMNKLGVMLQARGELEASREILEAALELRAIVVGTDHDHYGVSLFNLGRTYLMLGEVDQGEASLREARSVWSQLFGPEHPKVQRVEALLAQIKAGPPAASSAE